MMAVHGITITRDQIYEFDYVLRRFNQVSFHIDTFHPAYDWRRPAKLQFHWLRAPSDEHQFKNSSKLKEEIFGVDYITDLMDSESEVRLKINTKILQSNWTIENSKCILVFYRQYK